MKPQPFDMKPVAILSAAASMGGGAYRQVDLRKILAILNPVVMNKPEIFIAGNYMKFDKEGQIKDEQTLKFI